MKIFEYALLGALCFGSVHASPVNGGNNSSASFTSVVIFGDSYTDQGVHSYQPGPNGTVLQPKTVASTGGRVWPEYVQQYSGVNVYDYAVSGAVCDANFSSSTRSGVKQDQIPSFLADNSYVSNATGQPALDNPSASTVYAIWIGTNDLGNAAFLTEFQPKGMPLTNYTDCVFNQLDRLYAVGARNFALINIAPLNLAPQYAPTEEDGLNSTRFWTDKSNYSANLTQISEKIREYSTLANAVFQYQIPYEVKIAKRYPKSSISLFDIHSLLSDIWNHPSLYLNGTAPLNVTGYVTECSNNTCAASSARDSYMWYDELHPSEQTDRVIAREFVEVVKGTSKWATNWKDT